MTSSLLLLRCTRLVSTTSKKGAKIFGTTVVFTYQSCTITVMAHRMSFLSFFYVKLNRFRLCSALLPAISVSNNFHDFFVKKCQRHKKIAKSNGGSRFILILWLLVMYAPSRTVYKLALLFLPIVLNHIAILTARCSLQHKRLGRRVNEETEVFVWSFNFLSFVLCIHSNQH